MCRFDVSVDSLCRDGGRGRMPAGRCRCTRPQGDNFYVMPAQQLRRGEVSLTGGARRPPP